jgi:cell division protein YceG involved in septum cleavage
MKHKTQKDYDLFKYKVYHQGTLVDASDSLSDMKQLVEELEKIDKEDGVFSPNSYKITKQIKTNRVLWKH